MGCGGALLHYAACDPLPADDSGLEGSGTDGDPVMATSGTTGEGDDAADHGGIPPGSSTFPPGSGDDAASQGDQDAGDTTTDAEGSSTGEGSTSTDDGCRLVTYYLDVDGDGFGNPDDAIESCDPVGAYSTTDDSDCCDLDAVANPDYGTELEYTIFSDEATACGDWDFDCSGEEEQWVEHCGEDPGVCASWWYACPPPPCGESAWQVVQYTNGLCAVSDQLATQRCR